MNPISKPPTAVAILTLLLIPLWTAKANAQAPAAPLALTPATPATQAAPAAYRSALEGYQPYTDEKTVNWQEANDTTGRIGGWREYAKEAQQPAGKPEANPQAADAAVKPAPHAGHAKP